VEAGDVVALEELLRRHPGLAAASIGDHPDGTARTLLHVATDWPGHRPNVAATIRALVEAGADVDAPFRGSHSETALHWAASSDDVDALDALLDSGADIEATGAVIAGGTALEDATAFGQWRAARRLLERGARSNLSESATMGLMDRVLHHLETDEPPPGPRELNGVLWSACHGGQLAVAALVLDRGAEVDWVAPWDGTTPLDAARRSEADELADWLVARGAHTAADLT
jgi:hypothetical protein